MTEREALKLALEALETVRHKIDSYQVNVCDDVDEAITAIREALAQPEQEPVAWMHTKIEGIAVPHRPADLDKHPDRWTALYPESKPCPTCEALARTVMMDQTAHDAQRKPLSNQKIIEMYNEPRSDAEMIEFARAIEAAHGIKE